jgi:hypothetical protein
VTLLFFFKLKLYFPWRYTYSAIQIASFTIHQLRWDFEKRDTRAVLNVEKKNINCTEKLIRTKNTTSLLAQVRARNVLSAYVYNVYTYYANQEECIALWFLLVDWGGTGIWKNTWRQDGGYTYVYNQHLRRCGDGALLFENRLKRCQLIIIIIIIIIITINSRKQHCLRTSESITINVQNV